MSATPTPDLDAYFTRIGYVGARTPTLATLSALHGRHIRTIPFENFDVLLGRGVQLDLHSLERKLIRDRRGGYCFEHNGLFLAVLRALGFVVTPLIARVRWQVPADVPTAQTHMTLRVDLDGRPWLADVGFGSAFTGPIALDDETEQGAPDESRRLVRDGRQLLQQVQLGGTWHDAYVFTLDEALPIDFEVANWFTSTHPNSRFKQNLIAARADGDRRLSVLNRELTVRHPDGRADKSPIDSPDHLLSILAGHFGLHFPAGTRFECPAVQWEQ